MTMPPPPTPPGWYPDSKGGVRYWDGVAWVCAVALSSERIGKAGVLTTLPFKMDGDPFETLRSAGFYMTIGGEPLYLWGAAPPTT